MRIIAGPCQHESVLESFEIASYCRRVCEDLGIEYIFKACLLYTSPSPRDRTRSRMPSSA